MEEKKLEIIRAAMNADGYSMRAWATDADGKRVRGDVELADDGARWIASFPGGRVMEVPRDIIERVMLDTEKKDACAAVYNDIAAAIARFCSSGVPSDVRDAILFAFDAVNRVNDWDRGDVRRALATALRAKPEPIKAFDGKIAMDLDVVKARFNSDYNRIKVEAVNSKTGELFTGIARAVLPGTSKKERWIVVFNNSNFMAELPEHVIGTAGAADAEAF